MLYAYRRRVRRCTEFDGIWKSPGKSGGLYLTEDALREVRDISKEKIESVRISGDPIDPNEIAIETAEDLVECDWTDLNTDKKRQVLSSIRMVVDNLIAKMPPEGFGE